MDIVTHCGVPRYLHNNLPLGNPLGTPGDRTAQQQSVLSALQLAVEASSPTAIRSQLEWPHGMDWLTVYNRVDESNRDELRRKGDEIRRKRADDKAKGLSR